MINIDVPTRPAARYYGGAWSKAEWVLSYAPYHKMYLEPCMGVWSILAHKQRVYRETLNDLNGRVTNFCTQIRDNGEELARRINLTPFSELEYRKSWEMAEDPLEDARRFYCLCWMSINGGPEPTINGSTFRYRTMSSGSGDVTTAFTNVDHVIAHSKRLHGVQITHQPAINLMAKQIDSCTLDVARQFLIVFDPPFMEETRTHKAAYGIEPGKLASSDDDWHREAAEVLRGHQGPAIVLGRPTKLYEEIYEAHGWVRCDRMFQQNSNKKNRGKATESLWLSPFITNRDRVDFGLFAPK
jgi:DNA adenine methylase